MIRLATELDFTAINKLGLLITEDFSNINNLHQQLNDNVNEYYVYEEQGQVLGFISILVLNQEIEIIYLVVAEDKRNLGIATALINYLFTKYQGRSFFLEVNENNQQALSLYQTVGFKIINKRPNYYHNDTAIVMRKDNENEAA